MTSEQQFQDLVWMLGEYWNKYKSNFSNSSLMYNKDYRTYGFRYLNLFWFTFAFRPNDNNNDELLYKTLNSWFPKDDIPKYLKSDLPNKDDILIKKHISFLSKNKYGSLYLTYKNSHPSVDQFNNELSKILKERSVRTSRGGRRLSRKLNVKINKSKLNIRKPTILANSKQFKLSKR